MASGEGFDTYMCDLDRILDFWLWPEPTPAVAVISGVNHWKKDFLSFSPFHPSHYFSANKQYAQRKRPSLYLFFPKYLGSRMFENPHTIFLISDELAAVFASRTVIH